VSGQDWTAGDCRVRIGGVDEWGPTEVTYPLVFTGAPEELAPGWPPPVSQVFAVRPVNLATEVYGELGSLHLPDEVATEQELALPIGESLISGSRWRRIRLPT
jgi:hypothetical protein